MYKLYCFLSLVDDADQGPSTSLFATTGPAARALVTRVCPEARGYVQSTALAQQLGDKAPTYAGAAELYFETLSCALRHYREPQSLAPLWQAERARIAATLLGHERTVMRMPAFYRQASIKGVFPFRRRADLRVSDFQAHWWQRHGPIAAATESALYYPQYHPPTACYESGRPDFDGVTELHWPNFDAAASAMDSDQMTVDQATDARNFVDTDSVVLFMAQEDTILAA